MTSIYIIQSSDGSVKVGISTDPDRRLAELSVGSATLSVYRTITVESRDRAMRIEKAAHISLRKNWIRGEWFDCSAEAAFQVVMECADRPDNIIVIDQYRAIDPSRSEAVQCRMARAALGITTREAADLVGVSHGTIARIEAGEALKPLTVSKIREGFRALGLIISDEDGPSVSYAAHADLRGVCLRRAK